MITRKSTMKLRENWSVGYILRMHGNVIVKSANGESRPAVGGLARQGAPARSATRI